MSEMYMPDKLVYEDINIGSMVTPVTRCVTTQQMVRWAGAIDEYYQIHYDKDFAIKVGLPGIVVSGSMLFSFLSQMLTEWTDDPGSIYKLSCSFHGMHFPNDDIICRGKVLEKFIQDGRKYLECAIWAENHEAQKTVSGKATIALSD